MDLTNKTNFDLRYLIEYTDSRNEAWAQLLRQSPTNEDLRYLIEYTDLIKEAHAALCDNLNIQSSQLPNEEALVKEIAENVLARADALDMSSWHCGTSHCWAGWGTVLSPLGRDIEKREDTETAGCVLMPNYAKHFFSDNETALEILKTKV
jgi:hypothetical protein